MAMTNAPYLKATRERQTRSLLCYIAALLLAASVLPAVAQTSASSAEQRLFTLTNDARTEQGLAPVQWDDALAQAARAHADLIVQNTALSHQYPGEAPLAVRAAQAGVHFQTIAENIAMGPSAETIQKQWMKSPPHRANILDPALTAVGFAVIQRGEYSYAVADFDHSVASMTLDQAEQSIEKLLAARGVQNTGPRQDARQTCEMAHGSAGGSNPLFVMRWQSADLSALPSALEDRLQSGKYKTAAVGACTSANAGQGFTTYRLAVLLY